MPSSEAVASDRVVLCQHDGELAEFEAMLAELGVPVERHTGPLPSPEALTGARLVLVSGKRLGEGRTPPIQRWPRTIAVVDGSSRTLGAHLARIGVALVVRRPIHPHVLRLLLLHQLYRGPERRARQRVAIGHPIRAGGLFKQSATLLELSRTGARIELQSPPRVGTSIQLVLGRELTGAKPVKVQARVVRSLGTNGDARRGGEVGLAFLDPKGAIGRPIQAILDRYANGPPSVATSARTAPPPATHATTSAQRAAAGAIPPLPASRSASPTAATSAREAPAETPARRLPPSYAPELPRAAAAERDGAQPVPPSDSILPGVETEIELLDIAFDPFAELDAAAHGDPEKGPEEAFALDFERDDVVEEPTASMSDGDSPRDRRQAPRVGYDERVVALDEQAARVVVGRDLCVGGMRIEPNADLAVGDVIEIALHAGHDSQPLLLVGSIERDDGQDGLVLVFATLSPAQRQRLDAILSAKGSIVAVEGGDEPDAGGASVPEAGADLEAEDGDSLVVGELVRRVLQADGGASHAKLQGVATEARRASRGSSA